MQEVIPEGAVVFPKGALEPGQQEAVARLYKQLSDANLVWADGHLGNIYFQRAGAGWEAGILDADMITRFDAPIHSEFLRDRLAQVFLKTQDV